MITVRPGSHVYQLLRLLSVSGEYPAQSLGVLGDVRTVKAMVHKMEAVQNIRLSDDTKLTTRLFHVSGRGGNRTVRLNKNALEILNELHPDALGHYLASFPDNRFTGNQYNIWRNHRIGEAIALCMMAGVETAPYVLPRLQKKTIRPIVPRAPSYYVARNFKKIFEAELNKTSFTRIAGLLFYPGGAYAVYNTRSAVMKWSGFGELKARQELSEIVRMNASLDEVTSALLLGADESIALQTLLESDKSPKRQSRFDKIYQSVHFIPLNQNGIDLLRILTLPDWNERLMSVLFKPNMRRRGHSSIEHDATSNNQFILSHLDGDIARLIRFRATLQTESGSYEVICFPWQVEFLNNYLGGSVRLKPIEMPAVLKALGLI